MPLPEFLYAQVIKTMRRRRLVAVKHHVVFGTQAVVDQVLAACGWYITQAEPASAGRGDGEAQCDTV
jgi:hypothetical protein